MRAPIATVAAVAALAVIAVDAGAEPCVAHVHLVGTPAAIERVSRALTQIGVPVGPARAGCRTIEANVELDPDGGIAVTVGTAGRSEARVLSDEGMAASWLDSWLHDDAVDAPEAPVVSPPPPIVPTLDVASVHAAAPGAPSVLDWLSLSAGYEEVWSTFTTVTSWKSASVSACARVGAFCFGVRARARFQPSLGDGVVTASRNDESVLATASRAWGLGRIFVSPELGVGVGRTSTTRTACMPIQGDPTCPDNTSAVKYRPRVGAAIRVSLPMFERVWLDVLAGAAYEGGGVDILDIYELPPEPAASVQLGIGIRVGAP